jgi:hypothetical protein
MNIVTSFIANTKSAELMKPRQRAFYHPAVASQSAAMLGTPFANQRGNRTRPQLAAMRFRIISAIALNNFGSSTGPTPLASDRRNRVHQRQELGHVVPIRLRNTDRKGNPLSFGDDVVFRAFFPAIRGVRPRFCPPNTALTEELSTTAREKSILLAPRSRARSTSWIFCHTPCSCHLRRYRQQLIPEPHPNSCGSISQGIPLRNTYRIPIRARRRSIGLRPGLRYLRGLGGGSNGSISFHKPSETRSSTFIVPSQSRTFGSISRSRINIKSLC